MATFTIVHITDPHLTSERPASFDAMARVLEHINTLEPDLVIDTGDIAIAHDAPTWQRAADLFGLLAAPVVHVPGNHDVHGPEGRAPFQRHFGPTYYRRQFGAVAIIALDSAADGARVARIESLGDEQMQWLTDTSADVSDDGVTHRICVNHRPLYTLEQPAQDQLVEALLAQNVDLVLSGHAHGNREYDHQGLAEFATAPCIPIFKESDEPSYRVIRLTESGWSQQLHPYEVAV